MLLGVLFLLLGIGLGTSIVPALYTTVGNNATSVSMLKLVPGIEAFLIIIGFIIGIIGFVQQEKTRKAQDSQDSQA